MHQNWQSQVLSSSSSLSRVCSAWSPSTRSSSFPGQIGLEVEQNGGRNMARVTVLRWTEKYGIPNKAYTLRMRLGAFVNEVQRLDPGARVTEVSLKD